MKLDRFAIRVLVLAFCFVGPSMLVCQQDSAQETYGGEPVYRVVSGIVAPRAKYVPDPEYDAESRRAKDQGYVVLSVIVTKEGRTAEIKVLRPLTPRLEEQAIKTVSQWRFDPATRDGKPVAVRIPVQVSFSLR